MWIPIISLRQSQTSCICCLSSSVLAPASLWQTNRLLLFSAPKKVSSSRIFGNVYYKVKPCELLSWSPPQPSSSWDNSHARSPRSFPPWSCTVKKPNWTSRGTITYIFGSFSLGISVLIQISNGRTCSKVMLLTRSPTKMKSPEVLACRAMMLLKWLHSSLSSFS